MTRIAKKPSAALTGTPNASWVPCLAFGNQLALVRVQVIVHPRAPWPVLRCRTPTPIGQSRRPARLNDFAAPPDRRGGSCVPTIQRTGSHSPLTSNPASVPRSRTPAPRGLTARTRSSGPPSRTPHAPRRLYPLRQEVNIDHRLDGTDGGLHGWPSWKLSTNTRLPSSRVTAHRRAASAMCTVPMSTS